MISRKVLYPARALATTRNHVVKKESLKFWSMSLSKMSATFSEHALKHDRQKNMIVRKIADFFGKDISDRT
jgi:hypothetical protein